MLTCSVAVWLLTTSPKSPEELQRDLPSAVDETGQVAEAVTQIVTAVDLVGGMVAGADSIDDMALLRHGGTGRIFTRAYAPSTLGQKWSA